MSCLSTKSNQYKTSHSRIKSGTIIGPHTETYYPKLGACGLKLGQIYGPFTHTHTHTHLHRRTSWQKVSFAIPNLRTRANIIHWEIRCLLLRFAWTIVVSNIYLTSEKTLKDVISCLVLRIDHFGRVLKGVDTYIFLSFFLYILIHRILDHPCTSRVFWIK